MTGTLAPAGCCHYEMEIAINAPRERVWKAIFDEVESWWLPDFHVMGPDSKVTFDPQPGGSGLLEVTEQGGGLLWYSSQMYLPEQFKIYLIGHVAPEWGGPCTSSLGLSLEESESGTIFKLVDSRHGKIDDQHVKSNEDGWTQLFTNGLKAYVEAN